MQPAVSPFHFDDGALLVLDQRRLPLEERWLRCTTPEEVADAIRRMAVRGAPAIGLAAAYGLALAATEPPQRFESAAELLGRARPTAVNLQWAIGAAREAYRRGEDLLELARGMEREQRESDLRLAEIGAGRLGRSERVMTHCNTGPLATGGHGTAGGVLRAAWERGALEQVWVCETRPLLQGARLTAWELARAGVPFRLVADSAAGALLARGLVDRVLVGADRIAANGDVANKIGTYPLAVLARRHGLPFEVAAPRSTLDPGTPSGGAIPIEERDPAEVTRVMRSTVAPEGAPAFNPAFDVTPAELVSALVTEAGVLEAPYEQSIARALER